MPQLALRFTEGGGRFDEAWHPLLEYPLMMKCFRALQPELLKPLEKNKAILDGLADYFLKSRSVTLPLRLAQHLTEDLADTLRGMKSMMKKNDLQALQHTLAEKKAKAGEVLERLIGEEGESL